MKRLALSLCLLALALPPVLQAAGMYKRELPDGSVIYSDQPHPEAQEVQTEPPQVIAPFRPTVVPSSPGRAADREPSEPYRQLAITAPTHDQVVWNNDRLLDVAVTVTPPVRERDGHTLLILMDGEPVARSPNQTAFLLQNVFRGTHVLEALVTNRAGEVLQRSDPVTFHMRQHSILSPTRPRP